MKVWANESGALIDWLTEIVERDGRLVMQFEGSVSTEGQGARDKAWATGHSPNKTDKGKEDKDFNFGVSLKEYAEEKGAEFRWSTELIKLEQDESGRVVGIIARDVNDRHYIRINATKGRHPGDGRLRQQPGDDGGTPALEPEDAHLHRP